MITVGQILPDHPLGKFLMDEAQKASTLVEVGTGSGLGSTQCLAMGMRENALLISYEADAEQCALAIDNTDHFVRDGKSVFIRRGVLHRGILPYSHPEDRPQTRECWEHEMALSLSAPLAQTPPDDIDLLFLDGGEYTSLDDWLLLWRKAKVIVIDDCNPAKAVKNAATLNMMMSNPAFEVIRMELKDRNGWAAFRRKGQ